MTHAADLLARAAAAGITLAVERRVAAHGPRPDPALEAELREHADELAAELEWRDTWHDGPDNPWSRGIRSVRVYSEPPPGVDPGEHFFPRRRLPLVEEEPADLPEPAIEDDTPPAAGGGAESAPCSRRDPEGMAIKSVERQEEHAYLFRFATWSDPDLRRALRIGRREKPESDHLRALEAEHARRESGACIRRRWAHEDLLVLLLLGLDRAGWSPGTAATPAQIAEAARLIRLHHPDYLARRLEAIGDAGPELRELLATAMPADRAGAVATVREIGDAFAAVAQSRPADLLRALDGKGWVTIKGAKPEAAA